MSNIKELEGFPDLTFIDNKSLQDVRNEMVSDYLAKLSELGEKAELGEAHPDRLILYSAAAQIYQCLQYVDRGAKMNFLKYSIGEWLDNLAAYKNLTRKEAERATVMLEFTLSDVQPQVIAIPGGTRVKTEGHKYFFTDNYIEIPAGELTGTVSATALEGGVSYNNVAIGELKILVDLIGYVDKVTNITVSRGGADVESDDELTLRIYRTPPAFSVAGPTAAYEYWAMQSRGDIGSVKAYSPEPTVVYVIFMLKNGILPDENDIKSMEEYLRSKSIRPVADLVRAFAPEEVEYDIDLTYYINESDENKAAKIQQDVSTAMTSYLNWQREIGRDINPSKIYQFLMSAGAKRVDIVAPVCVTLDKYAISKVNSISVKYGGIEDD